MSLMTVSPGPNDHEEVHTFRFGLMFKLFVVLDYICLKMLFQLLNVDCPIVHFRVKWLNISKGCSSHPRHQLLCLPIRMKIVALFLTLTTNTVKRSFILRHKQ